MTVRLTIPPFMPRSCWKRLAGAALAVAILCLAATVLAPDAAFAQLTEVPAGTCTTDPQFDIPMPNADAGIISTIVQQFTDILNGVTKTIYKTIVVNGDLVKGVRGMLTLYVVIYGIYFIFGMVQVTLYDFAVRAAKIGIIVSLMSPGSWAFFSGTGLPNQFSLVTFFNNTTNQLINFSTKLAVNDPNLGMSGPPFSILDGAITIATSSKMAVTLEAMFTTGPYGVLYGLLIMFAMGSLMKALLDALWVYLLSLVLKSILFTVAPIFICFLLFTRTKHLFDGWLNQILDASLQPVLLFMFFGFFSLLIQACLSNMLLTPVCMTEWTNVLVGAPEPMKAWRFAKQAASGEWQPFSGVWTAADGFPIPLTLILTFLALAELAGRFNNVVIEIARDLSGAATQLRMSSESITSWTRKKGKT